MIGARVKDATAAQLHKQQLGGMQQERGEGETTTFGVVLPEVTQTVQVPTTALGRVIGKGGRIVREIREISRAQIQITDDGKEGDHREVHARGSAASVELAAYLINRRVDVSRQVEAGILVPRDMQQQQQQPYGAVGSHRGGGAAQVSSDRTDIQRYREADR